MKYFNICLLSCMLHTLVVQGFIFNRKNKSCDQLTLKEQLQNKKCNKNDKYLVPNNSVNKCHTWRKHFYSDCRKTNKLFSKLNVKYGEFVPVPKVVFNEREAMTQNSLVPDGTNEQYYFTRDAQKNPLIFKGTHLQGDATFPKAPTRSDGFVSQGRNYNFENKQRYIGTEHTAIDIDPDKEQHLIQWVNDMDKSNHKYNTDSNARPFYAINSVATPGTVQNFKITEPRDQALNGKQAHLKIYSPDHIGYFTNENGKNHHQIRGVPLANVNNFRAFG